MVPPCAVFHDAVSMLPSGRNQFTCPVCEREVNIWQDSEGQWHSIEVRGSRILEDQRKWEGYLHSRNQALAEDIASSFHATVLDAVRAHAASEDARVEQVGRVLAEIEGKRTAATFDLEQLRHQNDIELEGIAQHNRIAALLLEHENASRRQAGRQGFKVNVLFLRDMSRAERRIILGVALLSRLLRENLTRLAVEAQRAVEQDPTLATLRDGVAALEAGAGDIRAAAETLTKKQRLRMILGDTLPHAEADGTGPSTRVEDLRSRIHFYNARIKAARAELDASALGAVRASVQPIVRKIRRLKSQVQWSEVHDYLVLFVAQHI